VRLAIVTRFTPVAGSPVAVTARLTVEPRRRAL